MKYIINLIDNRLLTGLTAVVLCILGAIGPNISIEMFGEMILAFSFISILCIITYKAITKGTRYTKKEDKTIFISFSLSFMSVGILVIPTQIGAHLVQQNLGMVTIYFTLLISLGFILLGYVIPEIEKHFMSEAEEA